MSKRLIMKRPRKRRVNASSSAADGRSCIGRRALRFSRPAHSLLPDDGADYAYNNILLRPCDTCIRTDE